jgi:hypothetical protein
MPTTDASPDPERCTAIRRIIATRKQMAEISDYIPTNGIRYDEAFERLFDMDPRAAELRAKLNEGTEDDGAIDEWDSTRQHVDIVLRAELRNGALNAYQRDLYTGEQLRLATKDWEGAAILPGEELAFPPIYFVKSEFEAWLLRASGRFRDNRRQPDQRA